MPYYFRREDNDELVEVGFMEMMQMDAAGYLTLEDGVQARRHYTDDERKPREKADKEAATVDAWNKPLVSDALGFHPSQLADFEKDRKANGFSAIEFRKDPEGYHMQTVCHDKAQHERYIKHRGLVNKNGSVSSKVFVDIEGAKKFLERRDADKE